MPAYKDEERKTWYAKFNYKDWNGKNRQKLKRGFATRREAQEYERTFLEQYQGLDANMTFGLLASRFLEDTQNRKKIQTYENRERILRLHILPDFADVKVSDITPLQVRTWQNKKLAEPDVKDSSLKHYHSVFSSVFNYGIQFFGLKSNPVRLAGTVGGKKPKNEEMVIWTPEHFSTFINTLPTFREQVFYETLYYSGMRIGECLALTLDDIVWDKNILKINKNFIRKNRQDIFGTTKTEANRDILMPNFYMKRLRLLVDSYYEPPTRLFFFIKSSPAADIRFKTLVSKLDVPQITPHDLRHSHASLLIDQNMPITLIAKRLGHEDINTTLRIYAHLIPGREKELVEKLDNLFG